MIDFTADSPFAEKVDPLFPSRVRVLGLGQTGVAVCDQLTMSGKVSQDVWALDTDQQVIEGSVVAQRRLLATKKIRGLGCAGDLALAREVAADEEDWLTGLVGGCDFVILILSLAGATGSALAEKLIPLARDNDVKVMVLAVPPFACEGQKRQRQAMQTLTMLRQEGDSVLILPQEALAEIPAAIHDLRCAFHLMHKMLAAAARALTQVVCKRGLIQLSFADVRSLFGRYGDTSTIENCWMAHTENDLRDSTEEMVEELLESPLLTDPLLWTRVDHAIAVISGPHELGLSEVQEIVLALQERLPVKIPISTSASLDESGSGDVCISLLLATTAPVTEPMVQVKEKKPVVTSFTKTSTGTLSTAPKEKQVIQKIEAPPLKKMAPKPEPISEPVAEQEQEQAPEFDTGPLALPSAIKAGRYLARQEEMQFEPLTGGRFEKSQETIYRGENLDQPTFRRRRLTVRL